MRAVPSFIYARRMGEPRHPSFNGGKAAFVLLLLIVLISSCQSTRQARSVYITDSAALSLLPPNAVGKPIEDFQLIAASYGGNEFMAEAYLLANEELLDLTVFTASGQTICSIVWDGAQLEFSSPYMPAAKAGAEYIVMDLQLALYDNARIKKMIEEADLAYVSETDGEDYARMIYADGDLIWQAKKEGGCLKVENALRGYSYEVESLL